MIEPEAVPTASPTRRHRRAVLAGVIVLAVVAGALSLTSDGRRPEAKPLALMAGSGSTTGAEKMGAPAVAGASSDSRSFAPYPYGGWGLTFKVEGDLPDLPGHATAWTMSGPDLDRADVARVAGALGVTGVPVQRDGGWFVQDGERVVSAVDGGDNWSINYYQSGYGVVTDDAANGAAEAGATGPALSADAAERRVLDLIEKMGAPNGSWKVESTETDIGVGWACAAPAVSSPPLTDQDLKTLEARKLEQQYPQAGTGSAGASSSSGSVAATPPPDAVAVPTPAGKPAPDRAIASCPPPPAPVKGFNVSLHPLLDGRRADMPVWSVTLRSDGQVENLSGQWVTFERGGDYKLRGVDAALKALTAAPEPPVAIMGGIATDPAPTGSGASTPGAEGGSAGSGVGIAGATGSAPNRLPLDGGGTVTAPGAPALAIRPCPMPMPMPMPPEKAAPLGETPSSSPIASPIAPCPEPTPQVVTITGVELALMQAPVFVDGHVRLYLVPAYRFVGHFDNGTPWETSVIALHPDAIAPPPDFPITDGVREGGGGTGIGKAVPPTPPTPEIISEPNSAR